ncbi:N-acetylmuramic acid/N-acetylglucosamine kinase [Bryobacterales bacterium F-183]|nr:N-acetylmuramic acid/N-acetylglucosamine kinase [Bryobacterales bacterium F-183]
MSKQFYLGIDGGQSSTTALIGDAAGRVVGYGRGGPCNHVTGPEARTKFLNAIGGCVRQAAAQAGIVEDVPHFAGACSGFSGGAKDKAYLLDEIFTADEKYVTHDAEIALVGATGGEPGVMVIGGTGSIAFGRDASGKTIRAGGWGYVFGDEGGGFDLARQALRAALRMEEGWGPATSLRSKLLAATGASDVNDLLHRFYTPEFPRQQIAGLSRQVDEAAREGDLVAMEILKAAAGHLAGYGRAVRDVVFGAESTVPVRTVGGVFQIETVRTEFERLIEADAPAYLPAAGALLEAYRIVGQTGVRLLDVPEFGK